MAKKRNPDWPRKLERQAEALRKAVLRSFPALIQIEALARVDRGDEDKHAVLVKIMKIARKALGRKKA